MNKPNIINHEIVFNPTGNEFDKCRDELLGLYQLVKIEDYEYKFVKRPRLTIPRWVAEELDENYDDYEQIFWYNAPLSQSVIDWYENDNDNWYICNIYINSKALGVDLVEVEE